MHCDLQELYIFDSLIVIVHLRFRKYQVSRPHLYNTLAICIENQVRAFKCPLCHVPINHDRVMKLKIGHKKQKEKKYKNMNTMM